MGKESAPDAGERAFLVLGRAGPTSAEGRDRAAAAGQRAATSYRSVALSLAVELARLAARLKRQPASAVLISEVQAGSAAVAGGLRAGDLLLRFDGELVASVDDLHRMLTAERARRPCLAEVLRQGRQESATVTPASDD